MVGEELLDGGSLIRGHGEDVGESSAGKDDGLAGLLWLSDGRSWLDLCGTNRQDVWTGTGERWVEFPICAVVVLSRGGVDALATVTSDTVVTGRVEEGGAEHAKLGIFVALAHLVERCQVRFIVGVGGRDDFRGGKSYRSD